MPTLRRTAMPTLRRNVYLVCFYCGRKTSTRNDGDVRHFECPNCEATNYLDKNGNITDPPAEVTSAPNIPEDKPTFRSGPAEAPNGVFCEKCLNNQHKLDRSLAQYLPGDPDDPEYEERERNYNKFKATLEQQYPQVCAECYPKVLDRINQNSYAAKADHLRKMVEQTRRNQEAERTAAASLAGFFARIGRYMWLSAFVLQLLWHLVLLQGLKQKHSPELLRGFQGGKTLDSAVVWSLSLLPEPERLMRWSMWLTALSLLWNPHFSHVVRGFTRHLRGISTWYILQIIIIALHVLALGIPNFALGQDSEASVQLAAHLAMIALLLAIYKLALRSIRVESKLMFAPTPQKPTLAVTTSPNPVKHEPGSLREALDDVLNAPSGSVVRDESPTRGPLSPIASKTSRKGISLGSASLDENFPQRTNPFARGPVDSFGRPIPQTDCPPRKAPEYSSEMDWSPTQHTQSQHRAFNSFGAPGKPLRGFGEAPVQEHTNPFRRQPPPAPKSMAQKVVDRANAAYFVKKPELPSPASQNPFFRGPTQSEMDEERHGRRGRDKNNGQSDIVFKDPTFFPPPAKDDPRDPLSEQLGKTHFSGSEGNPNTALAQAGKVDQSRGTKGSILGGWLRG